jgi:2,4-dienoyl-CoA reductase (NADPH2)
MLQRKKTKLGKGLGKTTGWIHRAALAMKKVQMVAGVSYDRIDDKGLYVTIEGQAQQLIKCDTIVVCAGQLSRKDLFDELTGNGMKTHLIGGAKLAGELDAKRAIREGFVVAASI